MDLSTPLANALAAIAERDLQGLATAIDRSPDIVPGLFAWLEAAVDWEINRRAGFCYPLPGPRAAIDDGEIKSSLVALAILVAWFRGDGRAGSEPIAAFLELTASTLRAEVERTETLQ